MRGFRRVIVSLLVLFIVLVLVVFVLENRQRIVFSFLGWSWPEMPASVFVAASLIVGMLIGPIFSVSARKNHHSG